MTKERIMAMAQRDANREGKPMAVLNLNQFSPLYVVRAWDERYVGHRDLLHSRHGAVWERDMRYGTSYFPSIEHAQRYYKPYGFDAAAVDRKLAEGEIHIGEPPLKAGQSLYLIDNFTRYAIDEGETR